MELLKCVPAGKRVLFIAFNKNISMELQKRSDALKLPCVVACKTFHALGLASLNKVTPYVKKMNDIVNNFSSSMNETQKENLSLIYRLASLAKSEGIGILKLNTYEEWYALAEHHNLTGMNDDEVFEEIIPLCQEILNESITQKNIVDFDDMLYMSLILKGRFQTYDYVFVDESQDVSPVRMEMLFHSVDQAGRFVNVGDRSQAIYGWCGADSSSMEKIRIRFKTRSLPLSISYRCSKAVVAAAQVLVPTIQPSPTAPEGSVTDVANIPLSAFGREDAIPMP